MAQQLLRQGFERAQALQQHGRVLEAQALCMEILRTHPTDGATLHLSGVIAGQLRDWERAASLLGRAATANPQNPDAHNDQGIALKTLGRWDEALACYNRAIGQSPVHAEAYCNRGNLHHALGRYDDALADLDRAIAIKPDYATAHYNRGVVCAAMKRWDAALASYDCAVKLRPDYASALCNSGLVLEQLGQFDAALAKYDRAIACKPDFAQAHSNRCNVLRISGRLEQALESGRRATALSPDYAEAHYNVGVVLFETGEFELALVSCDRATALKPDYAEAHSVRGTVLKALDRRAEALQSYDRAIECRRGYPDAYLNKAIALLEKTDYEGALQCCDQALALRTDFAGAQTVRGTALWELGRWDEALACYNTAMAIQPENADAFCNRGALFHTLNRLDDALADYDRAIALRPDFETPNLNRAYIRLVTGDFDRGWSEHEWRSKKLKNSSYARKMLTHPLWLGKDSIEGKTIVLHGEQGLGDTIQFCRYAALVERLGAKVILEVQPPLLELLQGLKGASEIVPLGADLPAFDCHCPLMSLPLACGTTLSTIPGEVPYIRANAGKVAQWRERLGVAQMPRVGLVWSGGFRPNHRETWAVNNRRNIPLERFAPLKLSGIEYYSLQKGEPADSDLERLVAVNWNGPQIIDLTSQLQDFSDTAALIANLDLVISVDTSTAHLAGAMGRPVWILNRFDTCWRWFMDRSDSPWYPTATLYRQDRFGDWDPVIERVRGDLAKLANRP